MKSKRIGFGVVAAAMFGFSGAAYAECTTDVAKDDLTDAQVVELYECIKGELREGYTAQGDERATAYQSWGAAFTVPGGVGNHGSRFLTTFVNDTGYLEYVRFKDEGAKMPVGTVIAKESFTSIKRARSKKARYL